MELFYYIRIGQKYKQWVTIVEGNLIISVGKNTDAGESSKVHVESGLFVGKMSCHRSDYHNLIRLYPFQEFEICYCVQAYYSVYGILGYVCVFKRNLMGDWYSSIYAFLLLFSSNRYCNTTVCNGPTR